MGKVLQVRVWATTYDEDDVLREWPRLHRLAWPDDDAVYVAKQGVVELIDTLVDAHRFADWSDEVKELTGERLQQLAGLRKELDEALADWDPARANKLTDAIEDALSGLEKVLPKA
ncbi:hypothetical protein LN040_00465 [Desulfovibrio subterraneus]|jgi:hypothetical protein|uniref:Uncharacterized protein n=1 Tax=Desulfovibrio subterraneus TaxID=2718620 RepID=A0A7J0BID1_9BACT|nr:hypothetical protein [Desulfovibrio subterraneus]WBF67616.1 hypothetical protein LN040_00465 [Desulfovibrio subterraneus]GFM33447.1 hypothetical protein DSM101010T_18120 [Desulfovibrio subterraneus]